MPPAPHRPWLPRHAKLSTPNVYVRLTSSRQRRSKLKCSITKVNFSTHTKWWGKEGRPSASHLHTWTRAAASVPGAPHGIHVYGPVTLSYFEKLLQHVVCQNREATNNKRIRPTRPTASASTDHAEAHKEMPMECEHIQCCMTTCATPIMPPARAGQGARGLARRPTHCDEGGWGEIDRGWEMESTLVSGARRC